MSIFCKCFFCCFSPAISSSACSHSVEAFNEWTEANKKHTKIYKLWIVFFLSLCVAERDTVEWARETEQNILNPKKENEKYFKWYTNTQIVLLGCSALRCNHRASSGRTREKTHEKWKQQIQRKTMLCTYFRLECGKCSRKKAYLFICLEEFVPLFSFIIWKLLHLDSGVRVCLLFHCVIAHYYAVCILTIPFVYVNKKWEAKFSTHFENRKIFNCTWISHLSKLFVFWALCLCRARTWCIFWTFVERCNFLYLHFVHFPQITSENSFNE